MLGGFIAGLLGATLGIGGAPILIPIWLNCCVDSTVASSTTPTLILASSMTALTISAFNNAYESIGISKLFMYFVISILSSAIVKRKFLEYLEIITYLTVRFRIK